MIFILINYGGNSLRISLLLHIFIRYLFLKFNWTKRERFRNASLMILYSTFQSCTNFILIVWNHKHAMKRHQSCQMLGKVCCSMQCSLQPCFRASKSYKVSFLIFNRPFWITKQRWKLERVKGGQGSESQAERRIRFSKLKDSGLSLSGRITKR